MDGRVTVVIVTHESEAVVKGAMVSIPRDCPVICIDNGSQDRTREIVSRYPARLIRGHNIGFARASNLGAELADTEFVLFLNPDARIDADGIGALLEAADRYPDAAIFSPLIEDGTGRVRHREASRMERWDESLTIRREGVPDGDCCTGFVDGSVLLVRREFFCEIGGFDPNIFLYYEDDDLSYRLRLCRLPMIFVRDARAIHHVSSSSAPKTAILLRRARAKKISEYYMKEKYGRRAHPLLDAVRQIAAAAWYCLRLDGRRFLVTLGRLAGIATVLAQRLGFVREQPNAGHSRLGTMRPSKSG